MDRNTTIRRALLVYFIITGAVLPATLAGYLDQNYGLMASPWSVFYGYMTLAWMIFIAYTGTQIEKLLRK